ncbi:glucosamine-6-phosphate deaminase [Arthrobacter sulfonylureivorans]|uniref:glucosamine-6-phosphate deaminase n=1 Tax=Arthrobacter sulfonylureivorans TaxID=2486855 RepID=UPI0039E61B77
MEVIIVDAAADVGRMAARIIASTVSTKSAAVLGFATGSSPAGIYSELAAMVRDGALDLSSTTGFALDEYVGIPAGHPASYAAFVQRDIVGPLKMRTGSVRVPDGNSADHDRGCLEFENKISRAGGIDIQILGIGANGHIGFNEPTSSLKSRTRIKTLTQQTRTDNARFFNSQNEVPTHCITQGLGTILEAKHLLLVAQGEQKAQAIAAAVEGPVSSRCPASVLQFHNRATVIIDGAAAGLLELTDYYRHAFRSKP